MDFIDQIPRLEEYDEPQTAIPELAEEELKRNWEELLEPYKRFLAKLWEPKHPAYPRQKWICPRCGIRRKTTHGFCDECFRAQARERYYKRRARLIAAGKTIISRPKIEVTEETNNTFFAEHNAFIQEHAHNWALHVAKFTCDYDSVADYEQDILLFVWKESLYFDPAAEVSPKTFIIWKMKNAYSVLWRKLNAKKRIFWDSVLHLEDFVKPTNKHETWEDLFPDPRTLEERYDDEF